MACKTSGKFTCRALALATIWLLSLSLASSSLAGPPKTKKTPDVIVLIVADLDGVNIQYNNVVKKSVAVSDLRSLINATRWQARNVHVSSAENSTSVDFSSGRTINWRDGGLLVEPFAQAFKRFDLIAVYYIAPSGYTFRSLRDYSDRYVNIDWSNTNNTYSYLISIKDHNFDRLNLPLIVDPAKAGQTSGSGGKMPVGKEILLAFLFALAAGAIVVIAVNRITRNERSNRA
ncbi:MAG: hypothetical protein ABFD64_01720 [Armatimonadota bacterium]